MWPIRAQDSPGHRDWLGVAHLSPNESPGKAFLRGGRQVLRVQAPQPTGRAKAKACSLLLGRQRAGPRLEALLVGACSRASVSKNRRV